MPEIKTFFSGLGDSQLSATEKKLLSPPTYLGYVYTDMYISATYVASIRPSIRGIAYANPLLVFMVSLYVSVTKEDPYV